MNKINNKEPWLNKLKERVDNYSEPAPATGWEQLEKELGSSPATPILFLKRHRWTMAAAAALLAAVSAVGLYFLHSPHVQDINQVVLEMMEQQPNVLNPVAEIEKPTQIAQATPMRKEETFTQLNRNSIQNRSSSDAAAMECTCVEDDEKEAIKSQSSASSTSPSDNEEVSNDTKENIASQTTESTSRTQTTRKPSSKDKLHLPTEKSSSSKKGSWSMGANVGNAGSLASNNEVAFSAIPYRISMAVSEEGIYAIPDNYTIIFNEGVPYMLSTDEMIHAKHHQPVAVGFSARKNLKKGFSIETGLNFTLLSSDISMAGNIDKTLKQKLYYLGIPLKANWNFLDKKHVTLYVSAGGQIEKCVYGKLGSEKVTVKPVQFSIMGGVGAQFNVTHRLGIYVEPGVAYFFNDDSDVQTIRKEHPFNFNMQAGVRFTY